MALGASSLFFSTPQQSSGSFLFTPQQQQQQQPQPQPPQQHVHLLTKDKVPVTYHTKWADLHPDSQSFLLHIEARILEYRDESRRLDQCERLFDSLALNEGFEVDATRISQDLGGISTAMDRDKVLLQELMKTAKDLMKNAEVAVRSFVLLRSRFSRAAGSAFASNVSMSGTVASSAGSGVSGSTQAIPPSFPVMEFYSGVPIKPSPFLLHTVDRFEHQLQEYRQWTEELERLLFSDNDENGKDGAHHSLLQSLPLVLTNIHDFFIHVAAKVESLHQKIWSRRTSYLANQRKKGDDNNPFVEADRRESAKREAAAKRVHPTLQASAASQLHAQAGALLANPPTAALLLSSVSSSSTSMVFPGLSATPVSNTSTGLTSATAPSFSPSPTSVFGSSSAASPPLFGSGTSTAPSIFGSGTSSSLFGSGPAASAASSSGGLFGGTPMPSTGLFGASGSSIGAQIPGGIFENPAQPLGTGAPAFGIGTTQGTNSMKAKSRTTRRK